MVPFSIRELLGVVALLAVGLTWPLLLFFIIPFLVLAVLSRIGLGQIAPVIIAIGMSVVLGVLFSLSYWGYPFAQPKVLTDIRNITAIEQLTEVRDLNAGRSRVGALPAIPTGRALEGEINSQDVINRVLLEFDRRKLRVQSSSPISEDLLWRIYFLADRNGLLISGHPGYEDTKRLHGYVGIGR